MSFALNEVEAMAKRATRGAGYPWGLAEEASKATRWLCAQGLDGAAVLVAALTHPATEEAPLVAGTRLSDNANTLSDVGVEISVLAAPQMLLPFAAMAAQQIGANVTVTCKDAVAITDGNRLCAAGEFSNDVKVLTVTKGGELRAPLARSARATPSPESWEALSLLADRTYAPATEESRMLGAGAGLSDND